jgi:threonine dehydrogenase-like Zn-dependent dehydrogenase
MDEAQHTELKACPVCGSEAWPIAYGMILGDTVRENRKVDFAGCVMEYEERINPLTGDREHGVPQWACQNRECRHRWW